MSSPAAVPSRTTIQPMTLVLWQVVFDSRIPVGGSVTLMGSDLVVFVEDLYPLRRRDHLYLFSGVGIRRAVVVLVFPNLDLAVIANGEVQILLDPERVIRQRLQSRLFCLLEPLSARLLPRLT